MVWLLCLMAYQPFRLFNAKAILLEEHLWYYLTHSWEDKGVHTFLKGICPKVNVIARLEYELAYYDSTAHRFNHYTTRTPRFRICRLHHLQRSKTLHYLDIIHISQTESWSSNKEQIFRTTSQYFALSCTVNFH